MLRNTKFMRTAAAIAACSLSVACGVAAADVGSSSGAATSSSGSTATTLYDRLGKKDGIRDALELIVARN